MSVRHPIIAITGSSGAGTSSVTRTFQQIFRREHVKAAVVDWSGPRMWTRAIADVIARDPSVAFTQAGLNFHGFGDQNIRYSWVRYLERPSYRHLPGQVIAA